MRYLLISFGILVCLTGNMMTAQAQVKKTMQPFIAGLDSIRVELKIPGVAMGSVKIARAISIPGAITG